MGLLDAKPSKPALLDRVTLRGLLGTFAIGALASFFLEIVWFVLGFAFFTANESDVPWYYPFGMFITMVLILSVGGLLVTGLATLIQRFQGE